MTGEVIFDSALLEDLRSCFSKSEAGESLNESLIKEIHDLTIYSKNNGYADFQLNYSEMHTYFTSLQKLCNDTVKHLSKANRTIYLAYGAAVTNTVEQEPLGEVFQRTDAQEILDMPEKEFRQAAEALARLQSISAKLNPGLEKLGCNPGRSEHKGINMLGERLARMLKESGIKPTTSKQGVYRKILEKVCAYIGVNQSTERLARTCLENLNQVNPQQ